MKRREKLPSKVQSNTGNTEISVAKIGLISALVVALIGIIGAAINLYITTQASQAQITIPIQATQTAEARLPTLAIPSTTTTPLASDISPVTTPLVVSQPTVTFVSDLSPANKQVVQIAASSILDVAQKLPLIIKDGFDTNDYGWSEFQDTFEKGIQCSVSLKDSKYSISVQSTSTSGAAWCIPFTPRKVKDFYLSVETQLVQNRNSDIFVYYRFIDDNNFYYLLINQQTQTISLAVRRNGEDSFIVQSKFISSIKKEGVNKLTLLTLTGSHTLYINDNLEILLSNENSFDQGQIRLGVRVNEANQAEELLIDNFELRGE